MNFVCAQASCSLTSSLCRLKKTLLDAQPTYNVNVAKPLRRSKQQRRRRLRKRHLKCEFALLQTLSRLFQPVQFVKCWQIFLELNSKRLYQTSGKEKESRCLVFTSWTKREIRLFHVVVVERRGRNVQKSVQSSCFANLNRLRFCHFHCRRRCPN